MDAGFLSVVEIGQYFMTKDAGEQFHAAACREYTLPREDGSSQPRGWDPGKHKNWTRAGSHDQFACMVNMELRLEFLMDQINL